MHFVQMSIHLCYIYEDYKNYACHTIFLHYAFRTIFMKNLLSIKVFIYSYSMSIQDRTCIVILFFDLCGAWTGNTLPYKYDSLKVRGSIWLTNTNATRFSCRSIWLIDCWCSRCNIIIILIIKFNRYLWGHFFLYYRVEFKFCFDQHNVNKLGRLILIKLTSNMVVILNWIF